MKAAATMIRGKNETKPLAARATLRSTNSHSSIRSQTFQARVRSAQPRTDSTCARTPLMMFDTRRPYLPIHRPGRSSSVGPPGCRNRGNGKPGNRLDVHGRGGEQRGEGRARHAGGRAVRDDPGRVGDERVDRDRREGPGHDGHRHPDRDHHVHAGDGVAHDHRREDGRDPRPQARVHDRMRDLRVRFAHDGDLAQPRGADVRLVVPRRGRGRARDAGDRGAGGVELRSRRPAACVRDRDGGWRDRGRGRSADRRALHHLLVVALRVRGRGAHHRRGPAPQPAHGRHAEGGRCPPRPGRHRALRARARPDRLRDPALGHLGVRATEAGRSRPGWACRR